MITKKKRALVLVKVVYGGKEMIGMDKELEKRRIRKKWERLEGLPHFFS